MASCTFPLDIIVITDTSLLKEKASKSIFSQFLNLFTLSGTRINYGPYMHNEWARTAGTNSEEGGTRKPSSASQVPPPLLFLDQTEAQRAEKIFWRPAPLPPPPYLRFWMTGPPLDLALSVDLCTDHVHNLPSPCAASSQAFSVSAFQWRIQDEQTKRLTKTTWPETHWLCTIMRPRDMASALWQKPKNKKEQNPGGVLPYKRLMGMCRWMGSLFTTGVTILGIHFQQSY